MKSKEINKSRVDRYLNSMKRDIKNIQFQEEEVDGKLQIKLGIGNFFIKREVNGDYEASVKRLFEDFMTNTSYYYIRNFWGL